MLSSKGSNPKPQTAHLYGLLSGPLLGAQAMINLESVPGSVSVGVLAREFASLASRSARLQADLSVGLNNSPAVQHFVREYGLTREQFVRLDQDSLGMRTPTTSSSKNYSALSARNPGSSFCHN